MQTDGMIDDRVMCGVPQFQPVSPLSASSQVFSVCACGLCNVRQADGTIDDRAMCGVYQFQPVSLLSTSSQVFSVCACSLRTVEM